MLQVELTLNIEKLLPECLKKKWIIKTQTLQPNRSSGFFLGFFKDENTLRSIGQRVIMDFAENEMENIIAKQVSFR